MHTPVAWHLRAPHSVYLAIGRTPTVNLKRSVWKDSCILEVVPLRPGHGRVGQAGALDSSPARRPARSGQWCPGLLIQLSGSTPAQCSP